MLPIINWFINYIFGNKQINIMMEIEDIMEQYQLIREHRRGY